MRQAVRVMSNELKSGIRDQFLEGMSHAACTVNVVTTDGAAGRAGVTVSAKIQFILLFDCFSNVICIG